MFALLVPQAAAIMSRTPVSRNIATRGILDAKLRSEREKLGDAPGNTNGLTSMKSLADLRTQASIHFAR